MKKLNIILGFIILLVVFALFVNIPTYATATVSSSTNVNISNKPCPGGDFLGLPRWDAYLQGQTDPTTKLCTPVLSNISDVWLIIAAVIEMLLRIAGLGAVIMVIYGGIRYTTSMGSADSVNQAKKTITYSIIGLIIAVTAAFIVTFIAGSLGA